MHASMSSHGDDVLQYFSPKEGEVVIDVGVALDELHYEVAETIVAYPRIHSCVRIPKYGINIF